MTGAPRTARAWLDHLLEPGYTPLFEDVLGGDPLAFPGYAEQVVGARAKTGCSAAVLAAQGTVHGAGLVVIAFEFGFLGGSMGVAEGERVCRAFEHAAARNLPVLALTASGGARMQEGMAALAQMAATVDARRDFARGGRPFATYLRHPTTGGVFASFASTADLLWAEPGATIGFAGPRVAEELGGEPLGGISHTAETARDAGLIDGVLDPAGVREELGAVLALLRAPPVPSAPERPDEPAVTEAGAYERVLRARDPARRAIDWPTATHPLRASGAIRCGIASIAGRTAITLALDGSQMLTAEAFAGARRTIAMAERVRVPVVTFIDTPGADPRGPSELAGIAREIAETFAAVLAASVPTVACVTGEGGSGGALALAVCDRLLILEHAVFSVIAPEGAARILRRDDVEAVTTDLRPTAHDLRSLGLADLVVAEPPGGAAARPDAARASVHAAIAWALADAETEGVPTRARRMRWRMQR